MIMYIIIRYSKPTSFFCSLVLYCSKSFLLNLILYCSKSLLLNLLNIYAKLLICPFLSLFYFVIIDLHNNRFNTNTHTYIYCTSNNTHIIPTLLSNINRNLIHSILHTWEYKFTVMIIEKTIRLLNKVNG